MPQVETASLPAGALLAAYGARGAYTDCYTIRVPGSASLANFMAAFYTTRIFRMERWLLARFLGLASSDREAERLARGDVACFSAWRVEARTAQQALLSAGRTRSWLMVDPLADVGSTRLFFGSAIVQRRRGGLGWQFRVLLGFHKLYSRILLRAAARRLIDA